MITSARESISSTLTRTMFFGFIDRVSNASTLREALDASSARSRAIASRVANATENGGTGFALPDDPGAPGSGQVNLEAEMTSLADEQLRYSASASLLQKTYEQIRIGLQDH